MAIVDSPVTKREAVRRSERHGRRGEGRGGASERDELCEAMLRRRLGAATAEKEQERYKWQVSIRGEQETGFS